MKSFPSSRTHQALCLITLYPIGPLSIRPTRPPEGQIHVHVLRHLPKVTHNKQSFTSPILAKNYPPLDPLSLRYTLLHSFVFFLDN